MSIIGSIISNGSGGGGGSGTVTVTGPTPVTGNLAKFSGPTSIADTNISPNTITTLATNSIQTVNSLTGNNTLVLAAGSNVSVGQGSSLGTTTVTYNIPQSISTGATPTFSQITLAGNPSTNLQVATKQYVDGLVAGNLSIQGTWNAATNTPTLADGIGTAGHAYIVNVAGSQNVGHGVIVYNVGDTIFYTITNIWDVIPAGNTVVSINGQQGVVSLGLSDLIDVMLNTPLTGEILQYNGASWVNIQLDYNDLANLPTLGTAAALNVGVSNGNIPQLGPTGLPAVSGQSLTGLTSTQVGLGNVANVDTTNATNITSGILPVAQLPLIPLNKGGTNANLTASNGGITYSTATQLQLLSGTATANQILQSGSSAAPTWSTATYPQTTTANQLLYSSAANAIGGLTSSNNSVLVTNGSGVPSLSATLPAVNGSAVTGLTATQVGLSNVPNVDATNATNITTGTLASAQLPVVPVAKGGTNSATTLNNNRMILSTGGAIVEGGALTNGQFFIGGTGVAPIPASITGTANQITSTSGTNSITLSMPAIPSFLASSTTTQTSVTGNDAVVTVIFGTDSTNGCFDTTSNYNTSTGVFTAPFAGIYHFNTSVRISGLITANVFGAVWFVKNGNISTIWDGNAQNVGATRETLSNTLGLQNSATFSLSANDTIAVQLKVTGNATANVSVYGATGSTYFCGFLVR